MQTLRIDHPDIKKFISIKTGDIDMVKYSNISVLLTHDFMEAVKEDKDFDLTYESEVYETVKAKELWDKIIDTNLKGAFFSSQSFAQQLKSNNKPGSIINLGSLSSSIGIPTATAYTSSKSGILE
mgnify:CR=1 FL=1